MFAVLTSVVPMSNNTLFHPSGWRQNFASCGLYGSVLIYYCIYYHRGPGAQVVKVQELLEHIPQ